MSESAAAVSSVPTAESPVSPTQRLPATSLTAHRAEVEAKQDRIGALLADAGVEGLLLLDPANVAWLCGASLHPWIVDPNEWPAIYLSPAQRWLVASNQDSQRLFDLHLDGLGFQLKEWQWHSGRERLLSDLCVNKRMASDRLVADCVPLGPALRRLRCQLSPGERARLAELGASVAHAVEATCRTLDRGESEAEVAGHLGHRLIRRGLTPVAISVAADGRSAVHRRFGYSAAPVAERCVVLATASGHGLHATAARTVTFAPKSPEFRAAYDVACRVIAAHAAASQPGLPVATALEAGRKTAALGGFDHAWRDLAPGHVTGWQPVERPLGPWTTHAFEDGWAVVWTAAVGEAGCADTFQVTGGDPVPVTPAEAWPVKRIRVHGQTLDLPDILVRD